ncbi:MAG: hypothetical protein ACQERR_03355 [Pseudomonadota bacterium]
MSGQVFPFEEFGQFVRHEVAEVDRFYENLRHVTLLYFYLPETEEAVTDELSAVLRICDGIFHREGHFLLILPGTDKEGGLHVGTLLEEAFGKPVHEVASTWPEDGADAEAVIDALSDYARGRNHQDIQNLLAAIR